MTDQPETTSPVPEQVASTFRAFLLALGGYMAGKGWIDGTVAASAVPVILVGIPWLWNQYNIRQRHKP